jgi:3-phosphoshikimate 1-carboxyvinyltransferase
VLPIAGALGVDAAFVLAGRLPERPLSPLWKEMERMGCVLTRPTANTIRCQGKLQAGEYRIDGSVSSQFISGLLLALSLLDNESKLEITGRIESRPYIEMTVKAMELFGVNPARLGGQTFRSPGLLTVEGDWSNAAFFLSAQQLGSQLHITGLEPDSPQGDRAVVHLLPQLSETAPVIDASDIPDLVPILAVVAAAKNGATFTNIQRLRLKESDRVASVLEMLRNLGGKAESTQNCLTVYGTSLQGGTVNACGDHRIAMSAAIAATVCTESVTVLGAESVQKSYPQFWAEYRRLGGKI